MADNPYGYQETEAPVERKRGVDLITLFVGIATLLVSGYVLSDGSSWLPSFDFRWIFAGAAVFCGVLMVGASFRKRRP
ncbi:hypothetical protein [Amycolatopsis benzoatilytica]|uniref:hypothetical protein n=1 Tax=Amycolatopsis benzoatilytica TaxID=346045 RepID=UPI0003644C1B|nr:hypothetical protein [Amycolatopsis benzoatilytica]